MIKIGGHLTKLFQFITTQVTLCSFFGPPCTCIRLYALQYDG